MKSALWRLTIFLFPLFKFYRLEVHSKIKIRNLVFFNPRERFLAVKFFNSLKFNNVLLLNRKYYIIFFMPFLGSRNKRKILEEWALCNGGFIGSTCNVKFTCKFRTETCVYKVQCVKSGLAMKCSDSEPTHIYNNHICCTPRCV